MYSPARRAVGRRGGGHHSSSFAGTMLGPGQVKSICIKGTEFSCARLRKTYTKHTGGFKVQLFEHIWPVCRTTCRHSSNRIAYLQSEQLVHARCSDSHLVAPSCGCAPGNQRLASRATKPSCRARMLFWVRIQIELPSQNIFGAR